MVFLENQDTILSDLMDAAFILVAPHVIIRSLYKFLLQALNVLKFLHRFSSLGYDERPTPSWLVVGPRFRL